MAEFKYEIQENLGVISESSNGWSRELNLISWNGGKPKYDIRDWAPDHEKMGNIAIKIAANWQSNLDAYVNTESVSLEEMKTRIKNGDYTVALYPIGYGDYDAENVLKQFMTDNSDNIFGVSDPKFDSLMISAINAVSAADKANALHKAEQQLINGGYISPIVLSPTVIAKTPTMTGCIFDLNRGNFGFVNTVK